MDTLSNLFLVIIVTVVITALLVAGSLRNLDRHREPQVIYIHVTSDDVRGSGAGCLPLAILIFFFLLLLLILQSAS